MPSGFRKQKKTAYVDKCTAELSALAAQGVQAGGNAFSEILLVKAKEKNPDTAPFSGRDADALRAALARLGYEPTDWEWLYAKTTAGEVLSPALFRQAICALDPVSVILCDEASQELFSQTYKTELLAVSGKERIQTGTNVYVAGLRVAALGNFDSALDSEKEKQRAWAQLKKMAPLREPY